MSWSNSDFKKRLRSQVDNYRPASILDESAENVIDKRDIDAKSLFKSFSNDKIKANPDKCHLLKSSTSQNDLNLGNITIKNSLCEKLLRIKLDHKLKLNTHIEDLCKKASRYMH